MAAHFTPESMRFLRGLTRNNDRAWFEERRPIYERALKLPLLALVDEINAGLESFAPEFIRPPHKTAMRIFRDTRFSPDKRPYKDNVCAWWAARGLEKLGAGFYLQIGPKEAFVGAGVYAPERDVLLTLRRWLAENHEQYRAVLAPLLKGTAKVPAMQLMDPQSLTRNPKGFPPEHPASDLLRARNWGVTVPFPVEDALTPALGASVLKLLARAAPLVHLLNEPLRKAAGEERRRALL